MSNGIGRLRTMGIALQGTFGSAESSATFVLPLMNTPMVVPVVNKLDNTSALGSGYGVNSVYTLDQYATFPFEIKVDEDQFPLLFAQKFSVSSAAAAGETVVYEHTLSYANTTQSWFTLFLQDDQRADYVMQDVLLSGLNLTLGRDFVKITGDAVGKLPASGSVTNTVTQPKEFVGRNVSYRDNDYGSAVAARDILSATANHAFNLTSEDERFKLGSGDIALNLITEDMYTLEIQKNKDGTDYYDDYVNNTKKVYDLTITDTSRYVTGSVANTNPSILLEYPAGYISEYAEDGGLSDLVKESFTLKAVDEIGVTNAPLKITVVNATASY